jgi:hypothetical protein
MNEITQLALKEWARRVSIATLKIIPPSTNNTPKARREAALAAAVKGLDRKQLAIEELSSYLTYAESILAQEE